MSFSSFSSFSHDTKSSLAALSETAKRDCCKKAELYGILLAAQTFSRQKCKLVTSSEPLARLTMKLLDIEYGVIGNLYVTERKSGELCERSSYKITISQKKELDRLFILLKYAPDTPEFEIRRELLKCPACAPAFVRGVFMSSGTVTNPEKSYHLEISLLSSELAASLADFLAEQELTPKLMTRKNESVLYYKDSESIENFLAYIGANTAAFTIMNKKIERELRSNANRVTNGEVANLGKTAAAAGDQINAIKQLQLTGELDRMPDELQATARLRLEYPAATLSELAELHTPPITKSGVNHRLKKLVSWSDKE